MHVINPPVLMKTYLLLITLVLAGCATPYDTEPPPAPESMDDLGVLVFTKIAGFRHPSIADGVVALKELGATHNWTVIETQNGAAFNPDYLRNFGVVVWLSTTWDVLDTTQQQAFEEYMEAGGGFVGVHAAADTEYDWPWYGETLIGTWFTNHPNFPNVRMADVIVEDTTHPATAHLPPVWQREDEWYNFANNPRDNPDIRVLASVDENSYGVTAMGDHPIIWSREIGDSGRALYTGLGHTAESFREEAFRTHLVGAIHWAAGLED